MNELVFIQNDQALTTSLKVAEVFNKEHRNVIRDIRTLINQMTGMLKNEQTPLFQETTYIHEQNKQKYPMFLMNRDGFSLLVMGFTGKKALEWKLSYMQAFNLMEKTLIELLEKRKTAEWQEARNASKRGWRPLTDAIQKLIGLAREQGSTTEDKIFYMTYARLMNKLLHIKSGSRDKIESWQNYELEKFEFIIKCVLSDKVPTKEDHKKIYTAAKQALENYCELSFINQRFIDGNNA